MSADFSQEPRVKPLEQAEWDDFLRSILPLSPGGMDRPLNIFTTLAKNPPLFRRWMGFGAALLDGKLTPRQRELVILRTAHLCASEYEWTQHVPMARAAGVDDEEIESLTGPLEAGHWSEADGVLLQATDEIHEDGTVSDATWTVLSSTLDDARLIELVMLVGQYHLVATTVRTLRIALEEP